MCGQGQGGPGLLCAAVPGACTAICVRGVLVCHTALCVLHTCLTLVLSYGSCFLSVLLSQDNLVDSVYSRGTILYPSPRLPELKQRLDNIFKVRVGLFGCPVKGQYLNSLLLVGLFQLRVFCENTSSWSSGIWKKHPKLLGHAYSSVLGP